MTQTTNLEALNDRTYTEEIELANATYRRGTVHRLRRPDGVIVPVAHNAVAARLAAGYTYA